MTGKNFKADFYRIINYNIKLAMIYSVNLLTYFNFRNLEKTEVPEFRLPKNALFGVPFF